VIKSEKDLGISGQLDEIKRMYEERQQNQDEVTITENDHQKDTNGDLELLTGLKSSFDYIK